MKREVYECRARVRKTANEIAAKFFAAHYAKPFRFKNGGRVYKADNARMEEALSNEAKCRVIVMHNYDGTPYLKVDSTYPTSVYGVAYVQENRYSGEQRPLYTLEEATQAEAEIEKCEQEIQRMKDKISLLKRQTMEY